MSQGSAIPLTREHGSVDLVLVCELVCFCSPSPPTSPHATEKKVWHFDAGTILK